MRFSLNKFFLVIYNGQALKFVVNDRRRLWIWGRSRISRRQSCVFYVSAAEWAVNAASCRDRTFAPRRSAPWLWLGFRVIRLLFAVPAGVIMFIVSVEVSDKCSPLCEPCRDFAQKGTAWTVICWKCCFYFVQVNFYRYIDCIFPCYHICDKIKLSARS